jgi:hypothetical protein
MHRNSVISTVPENLCDNCGQVCPDGEQMYTLKLQIFARAEPLVFTIQDMQQDSTSKLEELVKEMENADPEEAEDEVFEMYGFDICKRCRRKMHQQLKAKFKQKK